MHTPTNQAQKAAYHVALATGRVAVAIELARRAVDQSEAYEDLHQIGAWYRRLVNAFKLQGQYCDGITTGIKALAWPLGPAQRARLLAAIVGIQVFGRQFTDALTRLGRIEEITHSLSDNWLLSCLYHDLKASICIELGDLDEAMVNWEKANHIQVQHSHWYRAASTFNNMGFFLTVYRRGRESEKWLTQALECINKQPSLHMRANILDSIGYAYTMRGKYDQAEQYLAESVRLFGTIGDNAQLADTLLHRSLLFERTHQWEAAQGEARRALQLATDAQLEHLRRQAEQRLASIEVPRYKAIDSCSPFHGMVFKSEAMKALVARLKILAATDEAVLIFGETGTGKELAARALHHESRRRDRPFVPFNCSTLSRELIESRLFGHRRGAFTGAERDHPGIIRTAAGGSLFLDEIGDLPLDVQGALLRFLQSSEIQPVGTSLPALIDVRVIAATNRDLKAEVAAGRFRKDLYFRLAGLTLELPRLAQRPEDVRELANYFLRDFCAKFGRTESLSDAEIAQLARHEWPGNVRELENYIKQRVLFSDHPLLQEAGPHIESPSWRQLSQADKQRRLRAALAESNGKVSVAARRLGISRRTIQKLQRQWQSELAAGSNQSTGLVAGSANLTANFSANFAPEVRTLQRDTAPVRFSKHEGSDS